MKKKNIFVILLLTIAIGFTLNGLFNQNKHSLLTHQRVTLPPKRIISLAPSVTEILYSLGLEDEIVAVSSHSDYPPEATKKPKVGDINVNYEELLAYKPDMIFFEKTLSPNIESNLRRLNLPYCAIDSSNFENFKRSILKVGQVTGREKRAEELLRKLCKRINRIKKKTERVPYSKKPRVFIEIWTSPLMTAGGDTFINYIVESAGGINVAKDLKGYPIIGAETLINWEPDVIILTSTDVNSFCQSTLWKNLKAVKNKQVFKIKSDIIVRPTMRMALGVEVLHNYLYRKSTVLNDKASY